MRHFKKDNFYRGVVEDNVDPLKLGRVRVRVFDIHSEDTNMVPTNTLPWAEVQISSSFQGLHQGIGLSSVLHQGTWVRVMFDDNDIRNPVVVGVISGIQKTKDIDIGFIDPSGVYPLEDRLGESDINRLTRVENLEKTIHQTINDNQDNVSLNDAVSGADVSQDEPLSTNNNSIYPYNNVIETSSGHVIEIDDSNENERIRLYHKSGSYIEIKPDGSIITKSNGDSNHNIILGNLNEHIEQSVKKYIEGNMDIIIGGYLKNNIKGIFNEHIEGKVTSEYNDDQEETIHKNRNVTVDINDTLNISGKQTNSVSDTRTTTIMNKDTQNLNGGQDINISGTHNLNTSSNSTEQIGGIKQITASKILLN